VLTRPKSGKTTLGRAFHMLKRVADGLSPAEEPVRAALAQMLELLAPYQDDPDLRHEVRADA